MVDVSEWNEAFGGNMADFLDLEGKEGEDSGRWCTLFQDENDREFVVDFGRNCELDVDRWSCGWILRFLKDPPLLPERSSSDSIGAVNGEDVG